MGFICEDNPHIERDKKLKPACDALNQINNDEFLKFEHLQKANMDQMATRLQSLEKVASDSKEEMQKLKTIIDSAAQKLIDQQDLSAENLWEKLRDQGNKLNEQIAESLDHINANFDEKLNVKWN